MVLPPEFISESGDGKAGGDHQDRNASRAVQHACASHPLEAATIPRTAPSAALARISPRRARPITGIPPRPPPCTTSRPPPPPRAPPLPHTRPGPPPPPPPPPAGPAPSRASRRERRLE